MSNMNMKAYLAEKYMSGAKAEAILVKAAPQKKKRRKVVANAHASGSNSGAMVIDDDGGWGDEGKEEQEDIAEAVVEKDRGFKKRKTAVSDGAGWATLQEGLKKEESPPPAADEQPTVVEDEQPKPFVGGLVSAKDLQRMQPKATATQMTEEEKAAAQETVYRDATGKKIDMKAAKAEAARKKREKEELEAQKMEWGKGLVQREDKKRMKQELQRMQGKEFRRADDDALNAEQKGKQIWNDPATAFLSKKREKGPRKPEYKGPLPPPNRFGIKPGYRWDGVDRGNGFEKKLFQRKNETKRRGAESYSWSVDDM